MAKESEDHVSEMHGDPGVNCRICVRCIGR